jgi:catechol 2,3-dioxygenase-like lactoylglutathione lyase family enzyme
MEVPGVRSKKSDNTFIHSQLGYSYITIRIKDTEAAVQRLKKAGVKPEGKGPAALPKSLGEGVFLTVVKDPDGNIVELVGP